MVWTYKEINRVKSIDADTLDVTVEFKDGIETVIRTFRFHSVEEIKSDFTSRMQKAITHIEFRTNPLNRLDNEFPGVQDIVIALVRYIRQNPGCTLTQVATRYDAVFPNAPWRASYLLSELQRLVTRKFGIVTWDQFKTFVLTSKLEGLDG